MFVINNVYHSAVPVLKMFISALPVLKYKYRCVTLWGSLGDIVLGRLPTKHVDIVLWEGREVTCLYSSLTGLSGYDLLSGQVVTLCMTLGSTHLIM